MFQKPIAKRTAVAAAIGAVVAIPLPFIGPILGAIVGGGIGYFTAPRIVRKFVQEPPVKVALERHDQFGKPLRLDPLPSRNSGCAVAMFTSRRARESAQEPVLVLALPLAAPQFALKLAADRTSAAPGHSAIRSTRRGGFPFPPRARERGRPRSSPLSIPPCGICQASSGVIDPRADEDLAVAIDEHRADPRR